MYQQHSVFKKPAISYLWEGTRVKVNLCHACQQIEMAKVVSTRSSDRACGVNDCVIRGSIDACCQNGGSKSKVFSDYQASAVTSKVGMWQKPNSSASTHFECHFGCQFFEFLSVKYKKNYDSPTKRMVLDKRSDLEQAGNNSTSLLGQQAESRNQDAKYVQEYVKSLPKPPKILLSRNDESIATNSSSEALNMEHSLIHESVVKIVFNFDIPLAIFAKSVVKIYSILSAGSFSDNLYSTMPSSARILITFNQTVFSLPPHH